MHCTKTRWLLLSCILLTCAQADPKAPAPAERPAEIKIDDLLISGRIDGQQLTVGLDFEAVTTAAQRQIELIQGEAVLEKVDQPLRGDTLGYAPERKAYTLTWSRSGRHRATAAFAVQPLAEPNSPWRVATLGVPAARIRRIEIRSDRPDLEVQLPGALRVKQGLEQGQQVIRAMLAPDRPLVVRWKPQVQLADAKLVFSSQANTIVDVRAGLVHLDVIFDFQVAQGRIESLTFHVPANLSITAINGPHIRNWSLADANDPRRLIIELSRGQEKDYRLHVVAEVRTEPWPAKIVVPAIEPVGAIRTSGHLAVGTSSAIQLVVLESSGLTQIDGPAFPRVQTEDPQGRSIPQAKVFFYAYASSGTRLGLAVDDVAPSYDVAGRLAVRIREDDLVVDAELELDVRDAAIRQLDIGIPAGLSVASVDGNQVEDYHLSKASGTDSASLVQVVFKQPVNGRSLVHLRLELGRGPLDRPQVIGPLHVTGAKTQRGTVVVAAEPGIEVNEPGADNLRAVHTASVPVRVAQAQFAYRYRQADWTLSLAARRKPPVVSAEVFHLESIGEALAYGSAVINYLITGSPLDELTLRLPAGLENVEFAGRDVRRWTHQGDLWTVKLTRKVIGDYNLAVTYAQRYGPTRPIQLGALYCQGVQAQTGYVVVTSHLDLGLKMTDPLAKDGQGLLAIALDELPGDYRMLTSSPILSAYKYVADPHTALLDIAPYGRSDLLPVVLDMASLQTRLAVRPDARVESMTTVRYKVKNTTGQFLALTLPRSARVWAVSLVESTAGGEQTTRLAASRDPNSDRLLVPLRRQANPNDPSTIELEYGQIHPGLGGWHTRIDLTAPTSSVPMTYADWQITVPQEWAIMATGGNMQVPSPSNSNPGLGLVLSQVGWMWARALDRWTASPAAWAAGILACAAAVLCLIFRRQQLPGLVAAALLAATIWIGIQAAATGPVDPPGPAASVSAAQAISADPSRAMEIHVELVPAWRRGLSIMEVIGLPLIAAGALALAVIRPKRWRLAMAAATAALAVLAADLPFTWPVLAALMTWGLPLILACWSLVRTLARRARPLPGLAPAALAVLVAMSPLWMGMAAGQTAAASTVQPSTATAVVERLDCHLQAGEDSMELRYRLRIMARGPSRLTLLDGPAVLLSGPQGTAPAAIRAMDGRYEVSVDKAGLHEVEATFVLPLQQPGEDQQRRFELPLPVALANSITLSVPDANVLVEAPGAIRVSQADHEDETTIQAMFAPGERASFTWRPRERQASREAVRLYARDMALAGLSSGLIQVTHAVRLQIAQGQMDVLRLHLAQGETVTSVRAPYSGAWRFDPATSRLEICLTQPVSGVYGFTVITQSAATSAPYDLHLEPLIVDGALEQHSSVGLAADSSVVISVDRHPAPMNAQDFVREGADLVEAVPGISADQITQAYRFDVSDVAVTGRVSVVRSELRSEETARFNVEDDRLVYNSQWVIEIAKAGRFDVNLLIPEGFDIDSLTSEQVSHWDESGDPGQRQVRVHFKHKWMGPMRLNLALSRPMAQVPDRLAVPRVMVADALKHTGLLAIGSEQGVRLSVLSREGVSEADPAELGQSSQGLLAFRLVRPDWQLTLQSEVVQPRVTVQTLHVARVTDGLVRHQHILRYRLLHAGTKTFDLLLPPGAASVTIQGQGIARREQTGQGLWRVELADKVYDQPVVLRVNYETRYDPADGFVALERIRCQGVDLQQGYTAVFATDRVELAVEAVDAALRPAEARSIPGTFGAGDLSGASLCYRSTSPDQQLTVRARRHTAAAQMGAEVRTIELTTVVTEAGQTLTRFVLSLRVGTQRHLQTLLPQGAAVWSLAVDGQAEQPSLRTDADGSAVILVALPQQASDEVQVDMVYVAPLPLAGPGRGVASWGGSHRLSGPRFDLPLRQINWQVYVPDGFAYDDFGGTLTLSKDLEVAAQVRHYDVQTYEQQVLEANSTNNRLAQQQQKLAHDLAQQGLQTDARRALVKGYNYSTGNRALNEDIRVDLDNLIRQQTKVGLVNARGRLRQQTPDLPQDQPSQAAVAQQQTLHFSQQQAERIENSLGQADNENLELIAHRIIQTQEAAEASVAQLQITLPVCGRVLRFDSPLQVEPAAEMAVVFNARPQRIRRLDPSLWYGVGLFMGLLGVAHGVGLARRTWGRLREVLAPVQPVLPAGTGAPVESSGQVSAGELV